MKSLVILLSFLYSATGLFAQNANNIYADVSLNTMGASATYDRRLTKHFQLGVGIQAFDNHYTYKNVTSSIFLDLRPYWLKRKNLFFLLADVGLAKYLGDDPDPAKFEIFPSGFYSAFGLGYCRIVTKKGMGPYLSLALRGASRGEHSLNPALPPSLNEYWVFDATALISLGFKF